MEYSYLELIIGPMFSGKTSHLINTHNELQKNNIPSIAINYIDDKRYSDTMLSSHDKVMIPCFQTKNLFDLENDEKFQGQLNKINTILINEGQFFEDLLEFVLKYLEEYKKNIYVCGLDSDFKRNTFGKMLNLIPHANNIIKLKSTCNSCNKKNAMYSHRITNEDNQIIISSNKYIPLCRNCYLEYNKTI